jgi:thiol-disulfide isomerase/thioredoxin
MRRKHKVAKRITRALSMAAGVAATGGILTAVLGCFGAAAAAARPVSHHVRRPAAVRLNPVRRGGTPVAVPDGRPTVLYFMSAQCGSCAAGEAELAHLRTRWPRAVRLVSVDVAPGYDRPAAVLGLARAVGAHWPQTYATSALLRRYHVTQLDQVVVLNRAGRVVYDGALPSPPALARWVHRASV